MINNDIVVIDVKSAHLECPCCFNEVKNLVKSCPKNFTGHNICEMCDTRLKKEYFKNSGCLYCGDKRTVNIERNTINIPINIYLKNLILLI